MFICSLLKPKKYASRRSQTQNQAISTICNDRTNQQTNAGTEQATRAGGGAGGNGSTVVGGVVGAGGMRGTSVQYSPRSYYESSREKRGIQVKTYMAEGNGYNQRSGSTTLYSKVGNILQTKTKHCRNCYAKTDSINYLCLSICLSLSLSIYIYIFNCNNVSV